jgi:hypothetical protein
VLGAVSRAAQGGALLADVQPSLLQQAAHVAELHTAGLWLTALPCQQDLGDSEYIQHEDVPASGTTRIVCSLRPHDTCCSFVPALD